MSAMRRAKKAISPARPRGRPRPESREHPSPQAIAVLEDLTDEQRANVGLAERALDGLSHEGRRRVITAIAAFFEIDLIPPRRISLSERVAEVAQTLDRLLEATPSYERRIPMKKAWDLLVKAHAELELVEGRVPS